MKGLISNFFSLSKTPYIDVTNIKQYDASPYSISIFDTLSSTGTKYQSLTLFTFFSMSKILLTSESLQCVVGISEGLVHLSECFTGDVTGSIGLSQ